MGAKLMRPNVGQLVFWLSFAVLANSAAQVSARAPDLTGVWMIDDPPEALKPSDGSPVPLTQAGRTQYAHNQALRAKGDLSFDLAVSQCASPGAVRMMTLPYLLEIFQRPYQVTMLFEWNHLYRLINTQDLQKVAPYPMAIGISNGHWAQGTLVVRTSDITDNTQLDASGLPHSGKLEVTERLWLENPTRLKDTITLHDPQTFSRDWSTTLGYHKVALRGLEQDICLDRLEAGQPTFPTRLQH
jgi:hypothetical protein